MNDVEEKYYADGENAYDMRKSFKDVTSKPAILPKGSGKNKIKDAKKEISEAVPSPPQGSSDAQPLADMSGSQPQDMSEKAAPGNTSESKAAQSKAKASKGRKR